MPSARGHRFTIYDALEASGLFEANPANTFSRNPVDGASLYQGPVQYPMMLYHPLGEERVIVPAEEVMTPHGPKYLGEQREILNLTVGNKKEHAAALAEGWHEHPARAVRARVEKFIAENEQLSEREKQKLLASIPQVSSTDRIKQLEAELARLTALKVEDEGEEADDQEKVSLPNGLSIKAPTATSKPA